MHNEMFQITFHLCFLFWLLYAFVFTSFLELNLNAAGYSRQFIRTQKSLASKFWTFHYNFLSILRHNCSNASTTSTFRRKNRFFIVCVFLYINFRFINTCFLYHLITVIRWRFISDTDDRLSFG